MTPPFNFFSLFGGDPGIYQTVSNIKNAIDFSIHDPAQRIRRRAELLLSPTQKNDGMDARTIFGWVKNHYRYVNDPAGLEYLKSPEVVDAEIDQNGVFAGDCDDVSAYVVALLKSVGYQTKLVIISPKGNPEGTFRHIYAEVFIPSLERWVSLDATAPQKSIGWHAPADRMRRYAV